MVVLHVVAEGENGMEIDRHALELVMRTNGERFGETPFKSEQYPFILKDLPYQLEWRDMDHKATKDTLTTDEQKEVEDAFMNAIRSSVEDIQDKKIGVLLSGGIDSSLVLYMIRKLYPNVDVVAYHADWGEACPERSEIVEARRAAEFADTEVKVVDGSPQALLPYVEEYLTKVKTPSYSGPVTFALYNQMGQDEVEVVLSGNGIDSFYGGDMLHKAFYERRRSFIPMIQNLLRIKKYRIALRFWGLDAPWLLMRICETGIGDFVIDSDFNLMDSLYRRIEKPTLWNTIQVWSVDNALKDAVLFARCASAHNIESRFPFLIQNLVDISQKYSQYAHDNKKIVRTMMRNMGFPESIYNYGADWNRRGLGGVAYPYFENDEYMDAITPSIDTSGNWFTEQALEIYDKRMSNQNPKAIHMAMFLKIHEMIY